MRARLDIYRNILVTAFAVFALIMSGNTHAQWIESVGSASMDKVSYAEAREAARQEALHQAMLQAGVKLYSHQSIRNGQLVADELSVETQVTIRREQIREESIDDDGVLTLHYAFDLERVPECPGSDADKYKKSVGLLGFNVQVPSQASIGGLSNIEYGLSNALADALSTYESMIVFERGNDASFMDVRNAPTSLDAQLMVTKAMSYARQLNVQYVVSGVVRDLGLVNPKAYSSSLWRRSIKFFAQANEARRFSVDLFVHDGLSGELMWQSNFAAEGAWTPSIEEKIGFGTQQFWKIPYGNAVAEVLDEMAYSLDQQLRCQPFMTRIARVDGKTLHFGTGASSGIRPGDKLNIYRSSNYFDAYQRTGIELSSTKTILTVSQVHPNFASGTMNIEPGRINIQQDDLLIIW